jgi:hypothetical protein
MRDGRSDVEWWAVTYTDSIFCTGPNERTPKLEDYSSEGVKRWRRDSVGYSEVPKRKNSTVIVETETLSLCR